VNQTLSTQKFLAKNSAVIASVLALSSVLGFLREAAIAYKFGATWQTDAFFIALTIPNLFIALVMTSLTKTFITVYSGYLAKEQTEDGWRMANVLLSFLGLLMSALVVAFALKTASLVHLFAPGFTGEQLALAVRLTRILLPCLLLGSLMGVLTGINNAHHSFLAPSLIGVAANVIMIGSIFILGAFWGIYGLAVGVLLGVAAQFFMQIPSACRNGLRFHWELDGRNPGLRETMRLAAPFVLSAAANQINLIVDRVLATSLPAGFVSALYFANKLIFMPYYIFAAAIGMVVFPLLTRAAALRKWGELGAGFQQGVRLLTLIIFPAGLGIFALRLPLVRLAFQHGAFTAASTSLTAGTIGYFLGALYSWALVDVVVNVFFALKKIILPVVMSIVAVIVNIGLSLWLIHPLEQRGLALANSLSSLVHLVLLTGCLCLVLHREAEGLKPLQGLTKFFGQVIVAATGMYLGLWGFLQVAAARFPGPKGLVITVAGALVLGLLVYGFLLHLLKNEEMSRARESILRKVRTLD
jgi:putative peptidoglycan lipid II flippase